MYSSQKSSSFFLTLLENSTDLISILDAEGHYKYIGGSIKHILGYQPEELIGLSIFDHIHEEDQHIAASALMQAPFQKVTKVPDLRFRSKSGEWRWIETTATNLIDDPEIQGYVTNSRDVTERVSSRLRLKESEQRFWSLFENHADAAVFQNKEGLIMDANPVALAMLELSKEEVLNRSLTDFLPTETVPICERTLHEALQGKAIRYEITIPFEAAGTHVFEIIKIPVDVGGETIGVYSIFRDMTAIHYSQKIIEKQANRLETILESIKDAFFTLDKEWCFSYVNSVFATLGAYKRDELIGKNIWHAFPRLASSTFGKECREAIESGCARHFEESYPLTKKTFRFSVYPSEEGLSVFFTDITDMQRSKKELEKLSLVASKTDNGVVITDAAGKTEWVNDAFTRITGYSLSEIAGKKPGEVLQGPGTDKQIVREISRNLQQGRHFNTMLVNYKKSGERFWLSMDITPILNSAGVITQFIAIQKDITYRKETEANLLQMAQNLYRQNKDLQQFSYIVSHNLRAPAANIMGLADIICAVDKNSNMFEETISRIKTSAKTLDNVIRDMNHILSIKESSYALDKEEVNIYAVCEEALSEVLEKTEITEQAISVSIDESLTIISNKAYLLEILKNLFSNAVKFRKKSDMLRLDVSVLQGNDEIELVVKDGGIGMNMCGVKNDLFKFYKTFHRGYEGRGMGLFLVKTYVDALGGSINVNSEPAKGTTFRIKFKTDAK